MFSCIVIVVSHYLKLNLISVKNFKTPAYIALDS